MNWSGGIFLSGGTSGNYDIVKYKWTFPTGAMKGYGTFVKGLERAEDPASQYEYFSGQPTGAANTEVKALGLDSFTSDDLEYDSTEQGDHVISTLYWGPEASGVESVSVTATVKNRNTGVTQDLSDKVNLNVIKPTGLLLTLKSGLAGVSDGPATGNIFQALQIDRNAGKLDPTDGGTKFGIQWSGGITRNQFGGTVGVIQTINYHSNKVAADPNDGNLAHKYEDGLVIDPTTQLPVHPGVTLDGRGATPYYDQTWNIGEAHDGNDSPRTPLSGAPGTNHYDRNDIFVSTLMYDPGSGGIPVPVQSLTWSWGGAAMYDPNQGKWVDDGVPTQNVPTDGVNTTAFPTWKHNLLEGLGNWTDRGRTTPPVPTK